MSQIRLTDSERTQALMRFGYSPREAEFLCRAALHGGYFLRRQYGQFLGRPIPAAAALLIEKVLRFEHAQATTYAANQHIYHLCARPFYAAIGQEDNRNRRLRQPMTIKNKLMGFDFVLQHPDHRYLATEREKIDYFCGELGLVRDQLPGKRYGLPQGLPGKAASVTDRCFVEKFPIFLDAARAQAAPPVVSFCFVDEGCATVSGFETFLHRYARLFEQLREYRVIYVAATDARFESAEALWRRFSQTILATGAAALSESELDRLLEHFEARLLFETRDWTSFDRAKLIRFREGERQFGGEKYAAFYRQWLASGRRREALQRHENGAGARGQGAFETCRLEQNYDLFGPAAGY